MMESDFHDLIRALCVQEGASDENASAVAELIVDRERELLPSAWKTRTPKSLAASAVRRMKELRPELFSIRQVDVTPRSTLTTALRNELLERYGISDPHQIAAIIPLAIRHKTLSKVREREPELFIMSPTQDELYALLVTTNPSEAATDDENSAYARARVKSVFAAGEEWLEAAALRRRAAILGDLARNCGISIGSAPVGSASSLESTTGFLP